MRKGSFVQGTGSVVTTLPDTSAINVGSMLAQNALAVVKSRLSANFIYWITGMIARQPQEIVAT